MTVLTEGRHANEALVAELPGGMSRDTVTLISGQDLSAMAVLGKITASGKYTEVDPAVDPADGSQTAAAVLYSATDATSGDTSCLVFYKDTVLNAGEVVWPSSMDTTAIATATAQLKTVGIILR